MVVNATALDRSGALSILKQFIDNIPPDKGQWLIFTPDNVELTSNKANVRLEPIIGVKPMHKRLKWDAIGLNKWIKQNNIDPVAAISLQNTGFHLEKKVPHFIYYHQPLPFFPNKWNPLKSNQRTFWFYKHIYPFFVNLFLKKDTQIFVQLDFIKEGFAKRFNHPKEKIGVYTPTVTPPQCSDKTKSSSLLSLIYPAMPHFYKNHKIIEDALKFSFRNMDVIFTTNSNKKPEKQDIRLKYIGVQPQEKIWEMYRKFDALLFPSYIETFGLPLLEAALTGMPIIASDLPYAREVLAGYEGVKFVKYDDPKAWAHAIDNLKKGKRYLPIDISKRPSWDALFNAIFKEIPKT
ncbi:MAG: glycosyltransferase [Muribaculaceae bacterium]|nr:glycosyltransferase [Muribaculaceae bacterium]